VVTDIL